MKKLIAKLPYNEDTNNLAMSLLKVEGETFYIHSYDPVTNSLYIYECHKSNKVFRTWKFIEVETKKEGKDFLTKLFNDERKLGYLIDMEGHTLEEIKDMGYICMNDDYFVEED